MHLAFLGFCPEIRELALAAAFRRHRITWYVPAEQRPVVTDLLGGGQVDLQPQDEWESLLDNVNVDGVVLAEAAEHEVELRSDQWRRLTQAGSRILFVHPVVPHLLVYLEVDMLARDSGAVLVPYWPDAYSKAATRLRGGESEGDELRESHLEQIGFRRTLRDRSPWNVTRWFARDAVLLEYLAGPFSEITAVGADASAAAYAALGVHLHGRAEIPVRWEVARAQQEEQGFLAATGPETELSLTFAETPTPPATPDGAPPGGASPSAEAVAGITAFEDAIRAGLPPEGWQRSVRAMELADSIEISLRRGRRIEVHYRQMTEETSYKGLMSAAGCGLLMLGLAILVFAGMLNAVFGWRLTRFWYVPVLVLFVGFLALQILARLLARRTDVSSPRGPDHQAG